MIGFATSSIVRDLPKSEIIEKGLPEKWHGEFTADLICCSQIAGTFVIPKGFITDGASIPHALWWSLSDTDPDILYPSYAHDLLYSVHGKLPGITLNKDQTDNLLREQMLAINTPRWKADTCFRMCQMFSHWKRITPPQKLARTIYAFHPSVQRP